MIPIFLAMVLCSSEPLRIENLKADPTYYHFTVLLQNSTAPQH